MVEQGLITREQAVMRITPEQVDFFYILSLISMPKRQQKPKAIFSIRTERFPRLSLRHGCV